MTMLSNSIRRTALALGLAMQASLTFAAFPDKPVRLVVPFPAGGSTDLVARVIAQEMSKTLGQPVTVDNRAGAGSVIGSEMVARAAPDGYTLLLSGSSNIYMPYLYKDLKFEPIKDFAGIGMVADIPNLVAVNIQTPYKTVADLVAAAKANPGAIGYASAGTGTPAHLVCELMATNSGIKLMHVPYKGNAPAVTDLLGGQVPVMCNNLAGTLPYMKGDVRMRILAITGKTRSPAAPNVPTFEEAGVKGLASGVWMALVAPKGTPHPVIQTLSNALQTVLASPTVRERFEQFGAQALAGTPADYDLRIKAEIESWTPVLRSLELR